MSEEQQWFYTDSTGAEHGPVSADELQQLGATGAIHALTDVWTEGLEAWVPASEIEGVIPEAPPQAAASAPPEPAHQPHINLGVGSGIHLESSITPRPMGQPAATPYGTTAKSPAKWIVLAIIALLAIGLGIYFALSSSGEPKPEETPGFMEYSKANNLINKKKNVDILGNNTDGLAISKAFAAGIKTHNDPAIEESFPGLLGKDGEVRTYTMAKTEGELKTTIIIVQVLKLKLLSAKAQAALADSVWLHAKSALAHTPYQDPKTRLVVALRDAETYAKVMIGHPVASDTTEQKATDGIIESHSGDEAETRLYPYFARPKKDQ
ncbi:MAG: DUF4339 domain-containing protein [Akkermansiaceae bacterium]|nr:DUF4339 domain-containing protein [Akkermansiaceae bacterium]